MRRESNKVELLVSDGEEKEDEKEEEEFGEADRDTQLV